MNTMKNNRRRGKTAGTSRKALAILLAATLAITMVGPGVSFAEEAIVAPDGSDVVYGNPAPEQPADSPAAPEPPAGSAGNAGSAAPAGEEGLGFDAFDAVVDPAPDPDEGPGAIGIMPLAVTPIGPGQVSIDNWADLRQAMGDPNVNYIRFNGDIRRTGGTAAANDLPGITRTLTIDGNGHELDFRNDGASTNINTRGIQLNAAPSTGATLTVQNLTVIKPNVATGSQGSAHFIVGTAVNSDRWTVNFNNLTAPKEGPTRPFCGLISAPRATLNVTGVLDWYSGAANAIIMETQQQYYSGANTVVNIVGHEGLNNSTVFIRQNQSTRLNIFSVRGGAQVYFDSRNIGNTNTIDMEINETATTRAEFIVDGVGTILDVKGLGRGTGTSGGTITMQAGARTAVFQVTGGAKCFVRSLAQNTGQPALVIQCDGTRFLADGKGTELLFESFGQSNNLGATLRFRLRGNQEFRASNLADITVIRHANTGSNRAAAIRFGTGTGNSFYAESGATIHVYNEGSAAYATSASGDNNNSGIEYRANNWTFDVTGYETAIEVYSNRGPAIGAGSVNNGNISVGDGSVFIAHGWSGAGTSASTHGAIDTGTVTFASTSPLYYDFTSLNPAANARVFNVNGAASRFSQTNSDIAAWGNGRSRVADAAGNATNSSNNPIEGNPYKSWTMVRGFTMGGNNFAVANQFSTQDPGYFTNAVDNFGSQGTWPYRRISGNNAAPKIGDVLPATNADKYVRATGRVPEGLDFDGRYVWDDEVYSRWNITRGSTTTTSVAGQATSLRYEDIYTVETGVDTLEGIVRYSNGEFLHPGDRYQIMQAWRGEVDDPNSQRVHHARPGDITTKVVTVEDILPPVPATVSTPSNGKIWIGLTTAISGTWTPNQAAAQPHNPEPAVKLYAVIDSMDKVVMDGSTPVAGTLDANGTWTYNLPVAVSNSLTDGQRVFFILEDANGNKTPLAPTPCHDTMIDPSPYLTASQPDLILNHDDQYIGLNMAKDIARLGTNTTSQLDRLKSLINARAERRAPEVTLGLDVRVTQVAPPWDTESYYNIDLFAPLWPMGKPYDLRYEAVAAPEIYNTGMVTVLPFDEAAPFIGANDFTISTNNATDLMSLPLAQRNAELIKLAGARARVSLTDPFTADLVLVHDVDIPNPAQVGSYDVTFYVNGFTPNHPHVVTIKAHVISGDMPVLMVTTPIEVWIGDAAKKPASAILPSQWNIMDGVTALSKVDGTNITDRVTYDAAMAQALNLNKKGMYPITYSVTNSDGNSIDATRLVVVNDGSYVVTPGYVLHAQSFIKHIDEVKASSNDAAILADSRAQAWMVDASLPTGTSSADARVASNGGYGPDATIGTYNITIAVVQDPAVVQNITATVWNKDEETDGEDPTTGTRYRIGANNYAITVSQLASYSGMSSEVMMNLINASAAEAFRLTNEATYLGDPLPLTSLANAGVVVVDNKIPLTARSGDSFPVTFAVAASPSITVTVHYSIGGTPPVITWHPESTPGALDGGYPLVIPFEPGDQGHYLTAAEIKAKMNVEDAEDGDLWDITTFAVPGGDGRISTGSPGVYQVHYSVTDSDNMTTTATRAIVIQDGRFVIDPEEGIIIGAKNFVVKQDDVDGTSTQVRSLSGAFAYLIDGSALPAEATLELQDLPPGYVRNAEPDEYPFTWMVSGYSTVKNITGIVTAADEISNPGENGLYVVVANHFTVNLEQAAAMIAAGLNNELMRMSDTRVYPLVDGLPTGTPYVANNGGFTSVLNPDPGYPITYGVRANGAVVVTPAPNQTQVTIRGRVSQGSMPTIDAMTPLEVWIGEGPAQAPAISAAQYLAVPGDLYGVTAADFEDDRDGIPLTITATYLNPTTGVDVTTPGLYTLRFSVTDSDNNTVTTQRVVVVNDGSYVVSEKPGGYILYARSFVTLLRDVTTNPALIEAEILDKGRARLYNGTTGVQVDIDSSNLASISTGGYGAPRMAGSYNIAITVRDHPSGTLTKDIVGRIVDAEVITPETPSEFGPVTYVWGNNAVQTIGEAWATAGGGMGAVALALNTGAATAWPEGSITDRAVMLTDTNDYIGRYADGTSTTPGVYRFPVSDEDYTETINLTISVHNGNAPTIAVYPKPLGFDYTDPATATRINDGSGFLLESLIMETVDVADVEDDAAGIPLEVDYSILDVTQGAPGVPMDKIPVTQSGIYHVTYTVMDSDGNKASDSRAIILSRGEEYIWDDRFILKALSFVIRASQVDPMRSDQQILAMSEAAAWSVEGEPRAATVRSLGGYSANPLDFYIVTVQVLGHPDLNKEIAALVVPDGDPQAQRPGDTHGDNGTATSIIATNFRINERDANALAAQRGTPAYAAALIARADVDLRQRATSNFLTADLSTRNLVNDGGFATSGTLAEGDSFTITFDSTADPKATTKITAFVDNGLPPIIYAPDIRVIWVGDPANKPEGTLLPSEWNGGFTKSLQNGEMLPDVTAWDDYDGDLTDDIVIGSLNAGNFTAGDPLDMNKRDIYQDVTYYVQDSDYNETTKTVKVFVTKNAVIDGDYLILAYDFIETLANVERNGTSHREILRLSAAEAWRIHSNPSTAGEWLPVPASELLEVRGDAGYRAEVGDYYPIRIGIEPEPGFSGGMRTRDVTGRVVDKDVIDDGFDGDVRYVVAANHATLKLEEAASFVGLTQAVKDRLIERALAEAWEIDGGIGDWDADVLTNGIINPQPRGSYPVTFIPAGQPDIRATVNFTIDNGHAPEIVFEMYPLVLEKTAVSHPLTNNDLKEFMTVWDFEDGDLWQATEVFSSNGTSPDGTPIPGSPLNLDQANVGVWTAVYTVTDSHGNTTIAERAVVINDGRYVIDETDNIIIGARDYVVPRTGTGRVDGTEGQARSLSWAEAFDINGHPIDPTLLRWTERPNGYVDGAAVGSYPITWMAPGRTTTKSITAHVVDADAVDNGGKSSSYAIVASHFRVNLMGAQAIVTGGNSAYIAAAQAAVIPLVPNADPAHPDPFVESRAGFEAALGTYTPITFRVDGIPPASSPRVGITGTVSQGDIPILSVSTPLEVWVGSDPNDPMRAANSILPAQYSDRYDVTAWDEEDKDLTDKVVVTADADTGPVNLGKVGRYVLHYSVTDSDNNTVEASRVVVVNDGRYTIGGRILRANSFVTLLSDVTDNPALIDTEILGKSNAALYDGATNALISSTDTVVFETGGYRRAVGAYNIHIRSIDVPMGYLNRQIVGEVVDAEVIGVNPTDPDENAHYVFGNNIVLLISEAEEILNAADAQAALLRELRAGARRTLPNGTIETLEPKVVADGGFQAAVGTYMVTVADSFEMVSIQLRVQVVQGNPPEITATPTPLNIPFDRLSTANVSREQIMTGVVAHDIEDGPLTEKVVINPDALGNEQLPAIPLNISSVTQVTYWVIDSDGNEAQVSRALIVNDGSVVFDENYILRARSFVIHSNDVTQPIDALILASSQAQAWSTNGTPATTIVRDSVSMSPTPGDYRPIIGIQEYAALSKTITARVYGDGFGGGNGELYSIMAHDFRINLTDARALQSMWDDSYPWNERDYDREFILRSEAVSYVRAESDLTEGGEVALADDNGFNTAVFAEEGDPDYPTVIPVKFWVDQDNSAFCWINVIVSNGEHPQILLPPMREIWIADPADPLRTPGSVTPYEWDYVYGPDHDPLEPSRYTDGDVIAVDSEDGTITELMVWGIIDDSGDFVEVADPLDMTKAGFQTVSYSVTDSDYNTTVETDFVLINDGTYVRGGSYVLQAYDFIKKLDDVTGTDDEILAASLAKAWRIEVLDPKDRPLLPIEKNELLYVADNAGYMKAVGEYAPIKITLEPEPLYADGKPVRSITGKVVDKDVIEDGFKGNNRYVVGANHADLSFGEATSFVGDSPLTKALLIDRANAEAWEITTKIEDWDVDVVYNEIGAPDHPIVPGGSYQVTFIPRGVPDVQATVIFTIDLGLLPIITADGPLVYDQTPASALLTREQLLEGITVIDAKVPDRGLSDVVITDATALNPAEPREDFPRIDTAVVGVWQVTYTITDTHLLVDDGQGNMVPATASVTRAVIVNDGRFIIDEDFEVIIGAKNFVVSTQDPSFTGTVQNAIDLSFAEAYDFEGNALPVALASTLPAGFANRELGVYDFTFIPVGYPEVPKDIVGEVVDSDVVDLGSDPYAAKHALIASHFTMDVAQAALVDGDVGLISAASARVINLVPTATDESVTVLDDGGFTAVRGVYPIVFGVTSYTPAEHSAAINGTVTNATPPTLSVTTPFEVAVGTPWERPLSMTGVSAADPGDGDITHLVEYYPTNPARPVNTALPGIYSVTYEVTGSSGDTVTARRAVVVNDGRYVVGDGRILEAHPFVIKLDDVPADAAQIPQHLVGMTGARLFDGETGDELPSSLINITSTGGYTRAVGTYNIAVSAPDLPSGTLTKVVEGRVVAADVIENEPVEPEDPTGAQVYVYGNNIVLRIGEAAAITTDAALLKALGAGAALTDLEGFIHDQDVIITDKGGFTAEIGTYTVRVADVDGIQEIELTVQVISGNAPELTPERPIRIPYVEANGLSVLDEEGLGLLADGYLTQEQRRGASTAYDIEDGDLTDQIIALEEVPYVPGIYRVTLSVTDSDDNTTQARTAIVVDDGSFVFGDNYILGAYDFTIDYTEVDNNNKSGQIIERSRAVAAANDGTPADVMVADVAGYQNVAGQYRPVLSVAAEPTLLRTITATVVGPGDPVRHRVAFDPNGGTLTGPSAIYVVEPETTVPYLPSAPVREGYTFLHWATTPEGGTQFTRTTPVTGDMTVYAQWEKNQVVEPPKETPKETPKTGDTTDPWTLVLLMVASATVLGATALRRRNSKQEAKD